MGPGKGTIKQITNVLQSIEKCKEFNMPALLYYIEYAKVFDCKNWKQVFNELKQIKVVFT